ncbi:hypothetical protein [Sorangium sp. So ce1389]|uniref:hypothetical protein n=1 Tax=Sorangium sp. So ce1389 TaxID=3133336 RepID=UPI003F6414AF
MVILAACAPPPASGQPGGRPVARAAAGPALRAAAPPQAASAAPPQAASAAPAAAGAPVPTLPSSADFEGGVGPYPISLRLQATAQGIEGSYRYLPRVQELRLSGTVGDPGGNYGYIGYSDPAFQCTFEERAPSGKVTGTFEGICAFATESATAALPLLAYGTWRNDTDEHPFWFRLIEKGEHVLAPRFRSVLLKHARTAERQCAPSLRFDDIKALPGGSTLLLYELGTACEPSPLWVEQPWLGVVDAQGRLTANLPLGDEDGDGASISPRYLDVIPGSTALLLTRTRVGHGNHPVSDAAAWLYVLDARGRVSPALPLPSSHHSSCCTCMFRDMSVSLHALDLDGAAPDELVVSEVNRGRDLDNNPAATQPSCHDLPTTEKITAYRFNEKARRYEPHRAAPAEPALGKLVQGKKPLATY